MTENSIPETGSLDNRSPMPTLADLVRERSAQSAAEAAQARAIAGGLDLVGRAMRKGPPVEDHDHLPTCAMSQRTPEAWGDVCTCRDFDNVEAVY